MRKLCNWYLFIYFGITIPNGNAKDWIQNCDKMIKDTFQIRTYHDG